MRSIYPLSIRPPSESISISDWLTLITLCFAPLVVHIISGIPRTVHLQRNLPSWHDKLGFYNPTTIIWRYFALTDRRLRCKNWNSFHMVASNVRFWTEEGWDGSEELMGRSERICVRSAEKKHMTLLSRGSMETLVVVLQAVQSIVELSDGFVGGWRVSLATVFYPLAIFGFLRLPAAYWISDEGYFAEYGTAIWKAILDNRAGDEILGSFATSSPLRVANNGTSNTLYDAFPTGNWRGRLIRISFLSVLVLASVLSIWTISPWFTFQLFSPGDPSGYMTTTAYVEACFYAFMSTSMTIIFSCYCFRRSSTTTIIPCLQSLWYKIYTVILILFAIAYIIIASLETRKAACGIFTTRKYQDDCPAGPGNGGMYLGSEVVYDTNHRPTYLNFTQIDWTGGALQLFEGIYVGKSNRTHTWVDLMPWEGWCKGSFRDAVARLLLPNRRMDNASDWFTDLTGAPGFNYTDMLFDDSERGVWSGF